MRLMSLQGCWHLWKVTEIRKTFMSRKRQIILPPSKRHKRTFGELQAAQPCFSSQECYRICHYGRCSRHKKYQDEEVMRSNQSMPIHQGHILIYANSQELCSKGDTTGAIPLDSSKAFTSVSHSSLAAWLRIQTTGWIKNLGPLGSKQSVVQTKLSGGHKWHPSVTRTGAKPVEHLT